jgi:hypothetical protein
MTTYSIDWSHKEYKRAIFSEDGLCSEPEFQSGDVVATENMPHVQCVELHYKGVEIYKCNTDVTSLVRKEEGVEKTDENDAKIIYEEFMSNPDKFRKWEYDIRKETLKVQIKIRNQKVEGSKKLKQRVSYDPILAELLQDELKESGSLVGKCNTKIKNLLKEIPESSVLTDIKGIGHATAGELVDIIGNVSRFPTLYHLWSYFGLGVRGGKAPRREKGSVANWHQRGRALMINDVVANGVIRAGSARKDADGNILIEASHYNKLYYKVKELEKAKSEAMEEPLSDGHVDNRARRKVAKAILKEIYRGLKVAKNGEKENEVHIPRSK